MSAERIASLLASHFSERDDEQGCTLACGYDGEDRAAHVATVLAEAGIGDVAEAERERLAFTAALEFGDDKSEPAATLEQMIDPIREAFDQAREHYECPVICELCGETLADTVCGRCHGSGCLPNAALAYLECDDCAGVGRVHEGCAEQSYADLRARAERAEATLADVRALADEWQGTYDRWIGVPDGPRVSIYHAHASRLLAVLDRSASKAGEGHG